MFSAMLNNIEQSLSVIAIMYFMGGLTYFMGRNLSLFYGQFSILWVMLSILWVATYFKGALYYNGATSGQNCHIFLIISWAKTPKVCHKYEYVLVKTLS